MLPIENPKKNMLSSSLKYLRVPTIPINKIIVNLINLNGYSLFDCDWLKLQYSKLWCKEEANMDNNC
jgi:hypothetical protein